MTLTIQADGRLLEALQRRAEVQGKSVSEVAQEILSEAVEEEPLADKTGHLRGQLNLGSHKTDPWRRRLRERNWRT
jgi:hypothetical protein